MRKVIHAGARAVEVDGGAVDPRRTPPRVRGGSTPLVRRRRPPKESLARLPEALDILRSRMLEAAAEQRRAAPGTARHRRAAACIAHLRGLFDALQRQMEISDEVWRLGPGRAGTSRHLAVPR